MSYGNLSDIFFVIHASVLYASSGFCFVCKFCILSVVSLTDVCELMQELNQKGNFTGTTIICQYIIYIVHIGVMQHIFLHFHK